jgi:hypothetical protein
MMVILELDEDEDLLDEVDNPSALSSHGPTSNVGPGTPSMVVTSIFPNKKQMHNCMHAGSSFMHIVTYKWIQKQYHLRKRNIIRDLRLILVTKAPNYTSSQLGVAYA